MSRNLIVSPPPHIRTGETSHCLMFDVYIALLPVCVASVWTFGLRAVVLLFLGGVSAKLTEALLQLFFVVCRGRFRELLHVRPFIYRFATSEEITVVDGSAVVTGMLLTLTLPPTVPYWLPVVGSVFAIAVAKQLFGGLGHNVFNPALGGRAFLLAAWPALMTSWAPPVTWGSAAVDAATSATPLTALKLQGQATPVLDLFLGSVSGSLGETSALAILLGAAYLLYKGTITWHIPVPYLATVAVLALVMRQDPIVHLCAGGLMLGAFFMATDVVTSPVTRSGRVVFGIGAGALTMLIRRFGGYPEGVCYAILIMNAVSPLIDRITMRRSPAAEIRLPLLDGDLKE